MGIPSGESPPHGFLVFTQVRCWRAVPEVKKMNHKYIGVTHGLKVSISTHILVISTGYQYQGDEKEELLFIIFYIMYIKY